MKKLLIIAITLTALITANAAPSAVPVNSWTQDKAERYLTIGPFAMKNRIKNATCNGTGTPYFRADEKNLETFYRYKTFNCKVYDKDFNSRQLKMTVTGITTYRATWLTAAPDCP